MADFFAQEIILGLTVQEFLLHLLNFVILFVALWLLLYKPVKKFMDKRKNDYKEAEEKYQTALKVTEEADETALRTVEDAQKQAVEIAKEAQKKALSQSELIIEQARADADKILADAKEEAKNAAKKGKEELYLAAKDMAYDVAEKLIARDVKTEDNDAFIDAILADVNKKEDPDA